MIVFARTESSLTRYRCGGGERTERVLSTNTDIGGELEKR